MLKLVIVAAIAALTSDAAPAANPACERQTTEKKLSSAGNASLTNNCMTYTTDAAR